jgi:Cu(I)/Ag(I) efflux system protein CusF
MQHAIVSILLSSFSLFAAAQSGGMKGMDMQDRKGMDMKGMDMGKNEKKAQSQVHKGTGVLTNVDRAGGKVTLRHEPIKSLNWPSMTMAFAVKDKAMLGSLAKDRKVQFEFVQQGDQFVITSIK